MLIAYGHSPDAVFNYTPRQVVAFVLVSIKRRKRETGELLSIHSLAAQGKPKDIQKQVKELTNGK